MKRVSILFSLLLFLFSGNLNKSSALDTAVSEKSTLKSNWKAAVYSSAEDETTSQNGTSTTIAVVTGAVAVVAVAGYFLLRKKK
jgi:LPXTG-motif cell wall-anchored protein